MAEMPPMPDTMEKTVAALWFTVNDGMKSNIEETNNLVKEALGEIRVMKDLIPKLETSEGHAKKHAEYVAGLEKAQEAKNSTMNRRRMSTREWVNIVVSALIGLGGLAVGLIVGLR